MQAHTHRRLRNHSRRGRGLCVARNLPHQPPNRNHRDSLCVVLVLNLPRSLSRRGHGLCAVPTRRRRPLNPNHRDSPYVVLVPNLRRSLSRPGK